MECSLNRWIQQNNSVTGESCRKLLIELKKQHLDQALGRLRGPEWFKVSFLEIKECYSAIENDFKAGAKGAKDTCAEMFVEFHGVRRKTYILSKGCLYSQFIRNIFLLIFFCCQVLFTNRSFT